MIQRSTGVVGGAVLLMVSAVLFSCSGGDDSAPGASNNNANSDAATPLEGSPATSSTSSDGGVSEASPMFDGATGPMTPLSITIIPVSDPDLVAPGRGAESWNGEVSVDVPTQGTTTTPLDEYYRFQWADLQTGAGTYAWSVFDDQINAAIDAGQKFSFGIMPVCSACDGASVGGATLHYPAYLHTLMQAETHPDWVSGLSNMWIPNWNSASYLTALNNLNSAINAHLASGTYKGVSYKNVIDHIDVRGYGDFGEWHEGEIVSQMSDHPTGTRATDATLEAIIDAHVNQFPDYPLVAMLSTFDGNRLQNTMNSPAVGYHALTAKNNFGPLGWRRDNWGALDDYLVQYTTGNDTTFDSLLFSDAILNRYKTSPVVGEPIQGGSFTSNCDYGDLLNQVTTDHATSFGDGNFNESDQTCMQNNIRAASKAAGYRLQIDSGSASPSAKTVGGNLAISLVWHNVGITPTYENWNVVVELRSAANAVAWSGTSSFVPKLFLPGSTTTTDNFALPTLAAGTYSLHLVVRDPNGYRSPLPLAIQGRLADGSYALAKVSVK